MKCELDESTAERECRRWKAVHPYEYETAESGYLNEGNNVRSCFFWEYVPVGWYKVNLFYLNGGQGGRVTKQLQ